MAMQRGRQHLDLLTEGGEDRWGVVPLVEADATAQVTPPSAPSNGVSPWVVVSLSLIPMIVALVLVLGLVIGLSGGGTGTGGGSATTTTVAASTTTTAATTTSAASTAAASTTTTGVGTTTGSPVSASRGCSLPRVANLTGTGSDGGDTLYAACREFNVTIPDRPPNIPGALYSVRSWSLPGATGPQVLIVHGVLADKDLMYCQQAFLASQGYRTLAVDLRGHGDSSKTDPQAAYPVGLGGNNGYDFAMWTGDLRAVALETSFNPTHWLGMDLGGCLPYLYDATYGPGLVSRLAWISANAQYIAPLGSTWPYYSLTQLEAFADAAEQQASPESAATLTADLDGNDEACMVAPEVPNAQLAAVRQTGAQLILKVPSNVYSNLITHAMTQDMRPFFPGPFETLLSYGTSQSIGFPVGLQPAQATVAVQALMPDNSQLYASTQNGFSHHVTNMHPYNAVMNTFFGALSAPHGSVQSAPACDICSALLGA
jgi:pimeloyl-ACP methyl ester carboxylesterase